MLTSASRRGRASALASAACVFTLYLLTVSHDLAGAGIDSAKFAYIPRILGVPHPPGYPLYMLLGWLFSHLPIGTLAFRMNLFSALCGAATAGVITLVALELGCAPAIAALVGTLTGTGPLFWSQAIIAEVYTLHTLLVSGMFLGLLRWVRSGSTFPLYIAAGCFGLGLAHHTDIALFVPAVLLFLALADARILKDVRVVATAIGLILLCLSAYAYVVIRTRQRAPYLEVAVTDVRGLIDLVSGGRFDYLLFRQPMSESVRERGPVFLKIFVDELGIPGFVLAVAGVWATWRRSRPGAAFIVAGVAAVLAFAFSYFAADVEVFLLPAFVLCWILAGVTLSTLTEFGRRRLQLLGFAAVAVWSVVHITSSYAAVAEQSNGFDVRFARAFFQSLPRHAAIVDSSIDGAHMLLYKILGEHAADGKDLVLVAPSLPGAPAGVFVYATFAPNIRVTLANATELDRLAHERSETFVFGQPAIRLRVEGYRLDPVRLPDRTIPDYLSSMPRGQIVAAVVPRVLMSSVVAAKRPIFAAIGAGMRGASPSACYSVVGVTGDIDGAVESGSEGLFEAGIGLRLGTRRISLPVAVATRCNETEASIVVNGREVSRTNSAVALVTLGPGGEVVNETTAPAATGLRVPFEWVPMNLYRLGGPRTCIPIGSSWTGITAVATQAGLTMHVPANGLVQMYLWSDDPLRVRGGQANDTDVRVDAVDVQQGDPAAAAAATVVQSTPSASHVTRVEVHPRGDDRIPIAVALGGQPAAAVARVDGPEGSSVCALTVGNYPILSGSYDGVERVLMDDARAELFGAGWHEFEADAAGGTRWTSSDPAHLLAPIGQIRDIRILIDALVTEENRRVAISVNGRLQPELDAMVGWHRYEWVVPAADWKLGMNDIRIGGTGTSRRRGRDGTERVVGLGVREIDFEAR